MIVASKLPNGLDLGGFVLRPAMLGHEPHQIPRAYGRERIANKLVEGFEDGDDQGLSAFCHANRAVRGWARAAQDGSTTNTARS